MRTTAVRTGARTAGAAWLYAAPAIGLAAMWIYYPMADLFRLSTHNGTLLSETHDWIGLSNFRRLIELPEFGRAVLNTVLYIVALVPFSVILPTLLAVAVWRAAPRVRGMCVTAFFLPVVLPPAVGAVVWQWLLNPIGGLVNAVLSALGLPGQAWLASEQAALWTIGAITGWRVFGISFLLLLAALTRIESTHVDAARVAGATEFEVTTKVLLPRVAPTIVFVALMTVILGPDWTFSGIDMITQGGPDAATTNVFYLMYDVGFRLLNPGLAAALALVILAIFVVLSVIQQLLNRRLGRNA